MHVDGFRAVPIAISAASDGLHVRGSGSDGSARRQSQARTRLGGLQTLRTAALGWWWGARAPSGSGTGSPQGSGLVSCRRAVCGARVFQRVSRQNQLVQRRRLPMRLFSMDSSMVYKMGIGYSEIFLG